MNILDDLEEFLGKKETQLVELLEGLKGGEEDEV